MNWKKGCSTYLYNIFGHQSQSYSIVFETVFGKTTTIQRSDLSFNHSRSFYALYFQLFYKQQYLFSWIQGSFRKKNGIVCCCPCLGYHIETHKNLNRIKSCFHSFTAVFIKTFAARTVKVINFNFSEVHLNLWCAGTLTLFTFFKPRTKN